MQVSDSIIDKAINVIDNMVSTVYGNPTGTSRENPAKKIVHNLSTSHKDNQRSIGLMRVNHCGEVCAQALYQGQAITARQKELKNKLFSASLEENDHLIWCKERLNELNGNTSKLNCLFYLGSFSLGAIAGIAGDKYSLGFLAETEYQVGKHLKSHLTKLPAEDVKSRAIVEQMYQDEISHAHQAENLGAAKLPKFIKIAMQKSSKIMTYISYYI